MPNIAFRRAKCDERGPSANRLYRRDRGAADHPAIPRIALIIGTQVSDRLRAALRFSDVIVPMKRPGRCDQE
jgi:hypothetical protein